PLVPLVGAACRGPGSSMLASRSVMDALDWAGGKVGAVSSSGTGAMSTGRGTKRVTAPDAGAGAGVGTTTVGARGSVARLTRGVSAGGVAGAALGAVTGGA